MLFNMTETKNNICACKNKFFFLYDYIIEHLNYRYYSVISWYTLVVTALLSWFCLQEELLLDVLGLAHQYGFQELEVAISDYLKSTLNIGNVCLIFDLASMYSLASLSQTCCEFMDRNAGDILHSDSFLTLSAVCMQCMPWGNASIITGL